MVISAWDNKPVPRKNTEYGWALLLVHNYLRFLTVEKMQSAIGSKPYSRV